MKISKLLILTMFLWGAWSCQDSNQTEEVNVRVTWELIGNNIDNSGMLKAAFHVENSGTKELGATGWKIYYSQSPRGIVEGSNEGEMTVEHINGDFHMINPGEGFVLEPGETKSVTYRSNNDYTKHADVPMGMFLVYEENGKEVKKEIEYDFVPFTKPAQLSRGANDQRQAVTPEWYYEQNQKILALGQSAKSRIVPTPVRESFGGGEISIDASWGISAADQLAREANYLSKSLSDLLGQTVTVDGNGKIKLKIDTRLGKEEAYQLSIKDNEIVISGSDAHGVFYGIQSLLNLAPVSQFKTAQATLKLPMGMVMDAPRYGYRGMHLDVARNFQSKESVLKMIDAMALYKMNKLHLHLTDDEGWRLESKALPELTAVGSKRGFSKGEKEALQPSYGSGLTGGVTGTGYYSQEDYMEILQYADERHIEVIPELNMPGHARAAITAMNVRYERLLSEGDEAGALEYYLIDSGDESEYSSAQVFNDNIVCVCNEAVYRFYETVVDEVIDLHKRAGVKLTMIHTGGDEVPRGSWEKSPDCAEFMALNDKYNNARDLQSYFLERVNKILSDRGLLTAGWEEVAMTFNPDRTWYPNMFFSDKGVIPYVWNNLWGNQDLGYKLANGGFPIVLCNVTNLYFDLAYDKDPREPGLYWGGLVDTRKAWEFIPEDVYKSTKEDAFGKKFDIDEDYKDLPRLTELGRKNILGIQGQIWSETINQGPAMLEYYYMPKLIGLAERAWAVNPTWAKIENQEQRLAAEDKAWAGFAAQLATTELPRLNYISGGFNYRIIPPGGIVENGTLTANHLYGWEIRYTEDGTDPTQSSKLYDGPTSVQGDVVIRAFDPEGNSSLSLRF